jgi:hypothetical protein
VYVSIVGALIFAAQPITPVEPTTSHSSHSLQLVRVSPHALPSCLQSTCLQRLLSHLHYLVYELRRKSSHTLQAEGSSGGSTSGYDSKYLGLGALDSEGLQGAGLIMAPRFCGAQLLQWLHDRKGHGEQLLRTVTLRLMWHVHQVFFNQLTHWWVGQEGVGGCAGGGDKSVGKGLC